MTRSRCIFPLIPRLCTLFRLACYISREAFLIIVPVKKYRLLLIRFDTGIFRRCIGTLTVLSYRCGPLYLTLMLLVANLANTKWSKKPEKWLKPWHMGTHLRVLSESYPTNTNMIDSSKSLCSCALDESSLSIGNVNPFMLGDLEKCRLDLWHFWR